MKYTFNHEGKEYRLTEENLEYFANDEIAELEGIDPSKVLELLSNNKDIEFENAYYEEPCSNCNHGKEEKKKFFDFLEFYFYAYGKNNQYVTSSIDDDYGYSDMVPLGIGLDGYTEKEGYLYPVKVNVLLEE